MQMTIVFKSDAATLSASVDVKDQNEAKRVAGELFAQTTKLQNGHILDLILKGHVSSLRLPQAISRLSNVAGISKEKAKIMFGVLPGTPLIFQGPAEEVRALELKLRDHGILAFTRKVFIHPDGM